MLAEFNTVSEALTCATNVQAQLAARNRDLPAERKLEFRIGVNLGEVIVDRGDIYGDGVNVAARLEALAEPGGICISQTARVAAGKKLDLNYEDLGEQTVKNIEEPVRAYRVTPVSQDTHSSGIKTRSTKAATSRPSIAVLPFRRIGGDADDDYFAEGITEEIRTGIGRFREVVLAASGSAFLMTNESMDVGESAKKLGVQYVLEGSVRRGGDRVRITANLIEGATGHQVWSERYDRVLDDIFELQDDVAQKIVVTLVGRIERADEARSLSKEGLSLSAYDYLLRGRHLYGEWGKGHDDEDIFEACHRSP